MAEVIQFDTDEDRLRALKALDDADETYPCIPPRRFCVTNASARLLREGGNPLPSARW